MLSLAVCMVLGLAACAQQAAPVRKDLLDAAFKQNLSFVEGKEVTLAPGQVAPRHLHPCPVVGYLVSGSVLFQVEGAAGRVLQKGMAFYEPKNKAILHFDNASKTEPVTFVVFYLKEGSEETIRLLKE